MKNKTKLFLVLGLFFVVLLLSIKSAQATAINLNFPDNTGLPENPDGVKGIAANVANWLLSIVGIIAVVGFVIAGFQYFFVSANEEMMKTAKKTMVASGIGIVVALSGLIAIKTIVFLFS
jgi:hypothetical protein